MTHWDDIYKAYEKGGDAWATLSEDIHPLFAPFLAAHTFPVKRVLDIGCGTGKYLKYLHDAGFETYGIDSSETALRLTKETVPASQVEYAEMFTYKFPENTFGLIVSVSTIQHGMKPEISSLVQKVHRALADDGRVFITIPSWSAEREEKMRNTHTVLALGTLAPLSGPEAGLAHSFYTEEEVRALFSKFSGVKTELDEFRRWVITAAK
jgi:2-polyprenyl-3-methyl-5-hydroxy-6-metoxy-1,4-benzoquinol methylase